MKPASQYSHTKGRNSACDKRCTFSSCTDGKFSAHNPHTGLCTSVVSSFVSASSEGVFSKPLRAAGLTFLLLVLPSGFVSMVMLPPVSFPFAFLASGLCCTKTGLCVATDDEGADDTDVETLGEVQDVVTATDEAPTCWEGRGRDCAANSTLLFLDTSLGPSSITSWLSPSASESIE